jgi:hypothetical protein
VTGLDIAGNALETVTDLPDTLRTLDISRNPRLTAVANLPANLEQLHAASTPFDELAQLPATLLELDLNTDVDRHRTPLDLSRLPRHLRVLKLSGRLLNATLPDIAALCPDLQHLNLASNGLTEIPRLPHGIRILELQANELRNLAALPRTLVKLNVSSNRLPAMNLNESAFPMLEHLDASGNELIVLDSIPSTVRHLNVGGNSLFRLPTLSNSLETLKAHGNSLTYLPPLLPQRLRVLEIASNGIESLPDELPTTLIKLDVGNNELRTITAALPPLVELNVRANHLKWLPRLPLSLEKLDASDNDLSRLDDLPDGLTELHVNGNRLEQIPPLPATLRVLKIHDNPLENLPALPAGLSELNASNIGLTLLNHRLPRELRICDISLNNFMNFPSIPDAVMTLIVSESNLHSLPPLPDGLLHLDASRNRLTQVQNLPASLQVINFSRNGLQTLPSDLFSYGRDCQVNLQSNPFNEFALDRLISISLMNEGELERLPTITYDLPNRAMLRGHVAAWYPDTPTRQRAMEHWHDVPDDDSFGAFGNFLEQLRETAQFSNQGLRTDIVKWLDRLATNRELRDATMALSVEALGSCNDRITLSLNRMKMLDLAAQINAGDYDDRLPDMMGLARSWFRLERLEVFARRKIEEQTAAYEEWRARAAAGTSAPPGYRRPDDVEVYLALQVRLRQRLGLFIDDAGMLFEQIANLSSEDYSDAERYVLASEQDDFVRYLTLQWSPWTELLKRLNPDGYEAAEDKILDYLGGADYSGPQF